MIARPGRNAVTPTSGSRDREIRSPEAGDAEAGTSPHATTYNAWPRTLREAKPKAGTVAGVHRCLISSIPATRTDRGSEAQKPDRIANVRVGRLSDRSYLQTGGPIAPTKNIGERTRIDQLARGPGRAEMLAKRGNDAQSFNRCGHSHLAAGFTPRVHPPIGSKPAKGATPGAPPDGKREEIRPSGQAAEDRGRSGTSRARNGRDE
jgi:hypothetical protein